MNAARRVSKVFRALEALYGKARMRLVELLGRGLLLPGRRVRQRLCSPRVSFRDVITERFLGRWTESCELRMTSSGILGCTRYLW